MSAGRGSGGHLLTVLHAAEPTGPPILALHFLRWLRERHPEWATSTVLIDSDGGLEDEFAALGPVVVVGHDIPFGPGGRLTHRAVIGRKLHAVRRRIAALGPVDISHVHCAGSMRIVPVLPDAPVLCHVHEMAVGLELHLGPLARAHITGADRYAVASEAVREALLSRFAIDPERVTLHWEFVNPVPTGPEVDREALGLPQDAFVVVSSGVRNWRKAPELFVRTALAARRRAPDMDWRFVWVGGTDAGGLEALVRSAHLDGLVQFVAHHRQPQRWFEAADAFFLPAREDAFPLVCVEAAVAGCPIVTFANGGATELVNQGECGVVVPFPDVVAAADALTVLARDAPARLELGARAKRFAHRELEVDQAAPGLFATIEDTRRSST